MRIEADDLTRPQVHAQLHEHLRDMHAQSPPESVHALGLAQLRAPDVVLYTLWRDAELLGCGALKALDAGCGEIKSMRTPRHRRRQGAGRALLQHLIGVARARGYTRLFLETGASADFAAAHRLYESAGFVDCPPFGDYRPDPLSRFMTLALVPGGARR